MRKKTKTKRKSSSLKKRKKIKIDLRAEGAAFWSSAAGKEIAASAKVYHMELLLMFLMKLEK